MHLYGPMPGPAAMGVLFLFSLYLGLYLALFGLLFGVIRKYWSLLAAFISAPLLWVAVEFARDRITGFPWDLLGYAQIDNLTLTKIAPWTGVFGVSLVIAGVNMLWAVPLAKLRRMVATSILLLAAILTGTLTWLQFRDAALTPPETTATALLLQENLSVGAGSQQESREAMLASFARLSQHPDFSRSGETTETPDLIAWPESPASFYDSDQSYRSFMEQLAQRTSTSILADDLSLASRNSDGSYSLYNSASFFKEDGSYGGRYDKIHLVPFGEYVPYRPLFFFAGHLLEGLPFVPGTQRVIFDDRGRKYGVFICYESIFGDEIRQFVTRGAQVLVNLSDDGWYGNSSAPWEHLDMVRMRAIENHRWVLRATNTGVTASIDPYGRIVDQMPRHVRGSLLARFNFLDGTTFYTRHGDWLAWVCVILTTLLVLVSLMGSRSLRAAQVN